MAPVAMQPIVKLFFHHRAMHHFFRHVRRWSQEGVWLDTCHGMEFFAVFVGPPTGDIPVCCAEACAFSSNFSKIKRGCLVCQVPGPDLGGTTKYPRQSFEDNQTLIANFIAAVKDGNKDSIAQLGAQLRSRSLHPVQSSLWGIKHYDANLPLYDVDHRLLSGIAQVALEGLRGFINELSSSARRKVEQQLDKLVAQAARDVHFLGERTFANGITGMGLTQQKIIDAIIKRLPGVLEGVTLLDGTSMDRKLVVRAFVLLRDYVASAR
eukprot:TRINITY_DN2514_c0_g2_i3.p3 TRINITY_DN2514_c0_g2~~TRINITY_DN2514_c0_g2_i3.p3  ORF type:complete len:266 (-),score=60.75 TRINITY_DN2514_c0_g2_i3:3866-4663(-)